MKMNQFVITINREYGSGGREIAIKIGEMLGVKVYDKAVLESLTERFGLSEDEMEHIKGSKPSWWDDFCEFYRPFPSIDIASEENKKVTSRQLYHAEAKILRDLAEQESCVIIGRSGFHIFKDAPNAAKILLIADEPSRVERIMKKYGLSEAEALERIAEVDKARENFTKSFAGVSRFDARNYDLVCNVSGIPTDLVAKFIVDVIRMKYEIK